LFVQVAQAMHNLAVLCTHVTANGASVTRAAAIFLQANLQKPRGAGRSLLPSLFSTKLSEFPVALLPFS
jgi:hypothetical protein